MCAEQSNPPEVLALPEQEHQLNEVNVGYESPRQRVESNQSQAQLRQRRKSPFMDKFVIRGGNPLVGTVRVSGAKNAALPAMAAALLTEEPVILENIPDVRDIQTERKLLVSMGAEGELGYGRAHHRTTIACKNLVNPDAAD